MFFDMFCISRSRVRGKKPHQKILFLAKVMNFFKSGSQYNYYTRKNFKSQYLKTTLGTFFEKTIHGRGPKLGSYVPLMSFNKLISGIYFKIFFSIFMGKNVRALR